MTEIRKKMNLKDRKKKKSKYNPMNHQRCCRVCNDPSRPIPPARAAVSNWICNACTNKHRDADPARYLAAKLAACLRKHGGTAPFPSTAFARAVYQKCHGKSVLSDECNPRNLCIVRIDPDGPWLPDNAVLVTSFESHTLTRCGRLTPLDRRHILYIAAAKLEDKDTPPEI